MWVCACGSKCDDNDFFCTRCGSRKQDESSEAVVQWYYIDHGSRVGPVSYAQMEKAIKEGDINKKTLIWYEGLSEWVAVETTSLKSVFKEVVPPILPTAINDKWLWCLATIPLLTNLVLFQLLRPANGSDVDYLINIVVFALNCVFMILDSHYLEKAGIKIKKTLFLGIVIVPIYLFVRAIKTNKNVWPAIIWMLFWFVSLLPVW